ncbi:MAG: hypothetical protein ACFFA8_13480 [Promethearchaeota archaeon]
MTVTSGYLSLKTSNNAVIAAASPPDVHQWYISSTSSSPLGAITK